MEVDDHFDPAPFIGMLEKFTKVELWALFKAHGGPQPAKKRALKLAKDLLDSDQGRVASVTLLEIQQTKCQIDINDDNAVAQLADRFESKRINDLTDVLSKFYLSTRMIAEESNNEKLLKECDRLRDDVLPKLGIQIEDTDDIENSDV